MTPEFAQHLLDRHFGQEKIAFVGTAALLSLGKLLGGGLLAGRAVGATAKGVGWAGSKALKGIGGGALEMYGRAAAKHPLMAGVGIPVGGVLSMPSMKDLMGGPEADAAQYGARSLIQQGAIAPTASRLY